MQDIQAASLTLGQMVDRLSSEIELAELIAQKYPSTHPIQVALANAQSTRAELKNQIPWYSLGGGEAFGPDSRQFQSYAQAVDAIYAAGAEPSDAQIPATIWPKIKALPWVPITLGAGALLGVALYFRGRRR